MALWSFTALASARACTKEKRSRVRKVLHGGADPKQPSSSCKDLVETCPTPSPRERGANDQKSVCFSTCLILRGCALGVRKVPSLRL